MSWKKLIPPGERLPLKLTATERRLLLEAVRGLDPEFAEIMRGVPAGKAVMMSLDDLEDFGEQIAVEAARCGDGKNRKKLEAIAERVHQLLGSYTDESDQPISVDRAAIKITRALTDLLANRREGVISFRLRPKVGSKPVLFPIQLTRLQREALLQGTRLTASLRRKLADRHRTQLVRFTRSELAHLHDELSAVGGEVAARYQKQFVAVQKKLAAVLDREQPAAVTVSG